MSGCLRHVQQLPLKKLYMMQHQILHRLCKTAQCAADLADLLHTMMQPVRHGVDSVLIMIVTGGK